MKTKVSKRENGSLKVQYVDDSPSMTQQQFLDQVDIRKIIQRRQALGMPIQIENDPFQGVIQDFSGVEDYRSNLQKIMKADQAFMSLPAALRQRFGNDPAQLISFLENDQNYDEALKLGLLKEGSITKIGKNDDLTTNNSQNQTNPPQSPPNA